VIRPQGDALVADCRLTGSRQLANQADPQTTIHFTGRVRLTKKRPEAVRSLPPAGPDGASITATDIYRLYFHGPAYQVLGQAWRDGDRIIGQMAEGLPNNHHPAELSTLVAPRLIELCFQTAGLWEMGLQDRMGLPQSVHHVKLLRDPAQSKLYAVVTPGSDQGSFDGEVVDAAGNQYLHLRGYRTVALPNSVDAKVLKVLQTAATNVDERRAVAVDA
jgi:hypothetical protein